MGGYRGIEGLPDTYIPWLGTGAQVAYDEKDVAELRACIPKGSSAEQQALAAESGRSKDPRDKKDRKG